MVREQQLPPEIARLPMAVIVALSLINPTLLLAIGTALGTWLAHRLGLVSHIVRRRETGAPLRPRLRAELALAFGLGITVAIATTLLDLAFAPHLGAAVLFGLGHLPAVAAIAPLTSMLVVRTVLLNALAGVVFGWFFWRRSLESAMLAHASAHVGFALMALAGMV
jgi:hypothetical protein